MKVESTIFFFLAILPSIIYGGRFISAYEELILDIAKKGGRIEGVFQPVGKKLLGYGDLAHVYSGVLFPSKKIIAMKFMVSENNSVAENEYRMYTYLDAINNPKVEQYGIPSVYYYGKWHEHDIIMMGISLLDQTVLKLSMSGKLRENDVNVLIILRDFIIASKYMHGRGVRHDDIKLEDIMVRGHRSFLIDFGRSVKMNQRNKAGSADEFASRRAHTNGERYPKDDWESFLYSICYSLGARFEWFGVQISSGIYYMKSNTTATKDEIEKRIKSKRLKKIMIELAKHVFDDGGEGAKEAPFYSASNSKRFPDYHRFYNMVNEEIEKLNSPTPAMFTWLSPEQEKAANDDFNEHGMPDITKISDPRDNDFSTMKYPDVDFRKFSPEIASDIDVNENTPLLRRARASTSSSECRLL